MIDPSQYWVLGVTCSIAASVLSCLGLIFQKYAHTQNQRLPEDKKYPVVLGCVCSPCWWASFMLMGVLPFPLDFLAYSFAAQSLVAPFAALTLILNQFFAPLILKEKLHRLDIYASVIVFVGTVMTTLTGNHDDVVYQLDDLLGFFKRTSFIIGFVLLVFIMGCMIVSLRVTEAAQDAAGHGPAVEGAEAGPGQGVGEGAEQGAGQALDEEPKSETDAGAAPKAAKGQPKGQPKGQQQQQQQLGQDHNLHATSFDSEVRAKAEQLEQEEVEAREAAAQPQACPTTSSMARLNRKLAPFYYGFVAGGFGALQNIFFKAVGVLFKSSVVDNAGSPWGEPYPYIFGIITIVLAVSQLSYLNMGMARYDAVITFPLYNACYIFLAVLMGALYFGEFATFVTWQLVLFPVGVAITLAGISLFCFKPGADHATKELHGAAPTPPALGRAPEDVLEEEEDGQGDSAGRPPAPVRAKPDSSPARGAVALV
jgi:hypothetical protein